MKKKVLLDFDEYLLKAMLNIIVFGKVLCFDRLITNIIADQPQHIYYQCLYSNSQKMYIYIWRKNKETDVAEQKFN